MICFNCYMEIHCMNNNFIHFPTDEDLDYFILFLFIYGRLKGRCNKHPCTLFLVCVYGKFLWSKWYNHILGFTGYCPTAFLMVVPIYTAVSSSRPLLCWCHKTFYFVSNWEHVHSYPLLLTFAFLNSELLFKYFCYWVSFFCNIPVHLICPLLFGYLLLLFSFEIVLYLLWILILYSVPCTFSHQ